MRNSMAKSLYSALFDWIVFRINHALLNIKDLEESTKVTSDLCVNFSFFFQGHYTSSRMFVEMAVVFRFYAILHFDLLIYILLFN